MTATLQEWDTAFCAAEKGHVAQLAALAVVDNVPPEFRERHQRLLCRFVRPQGRPIQRDADGFRPRNKRIADAVEHYRRLKLRTAEDQAIADTLLLFRTDALTENVLRLGLEGKIREVRAILRTRNNVSAGFRPAV